MILIGLKFNMSQSGRLVKVHNQNQIPINPLFKRQEYPGLLERYPYVRIQKGAGGQEPPGKLQKYRVP